MAIRRRYLTYLPTREGWLYLAAVLDLRTRQVLGYSLSERMPDNLVRQAFLNAWSASPVGAGVLFHSDRLNPPSIAAACFRTR
ncbi:transposase InsO family protein [Azomonas macrocytogenes]|uniref:Transposase InsO family protein n=1 Tax=Azomonas macrocytogenes TaxID=69962 RepID=A0A839TCM3_AZOMA|nr:transposase InsO family protein [Azomonas macrocytogenes]